MEGQDATGLCVFCTSPAPANISTKSAPKFLAQLGLSSGGLPALCEPCSLRVVRATRYRDQVTDVERDVRSLQRIILKMLRQLQSLQSSYLEEMRELEDKISSTSNLPVIGDDGSLRRAVVNVVAELSVFQNPVCVAPPEAEADTPVTPEEPLKFEPLSPASAEDLDLEPPPPPPPQFDSFDRHPPPQIFPQRQPSTQKAVKPFACALCPKRFRLQRNLVLHQNQVHRNPAIIPPAAAPKTRRHTCAYCQKSFQSPFKLRLHVYTHTGERPFKCPLCPQTFNQKGARDRHRSTVHEGKPHACPYCESAFKDKPRLDEHLQREHGRGQGMAELVDPLAD